MESVQPTPQAWGTAFRLLRTVRGFSQHELAAAAGFNPSYMSLIETGARTPSLPALGKFCAALDIGLSDLTRIAENPEKALGIEVAS